MKKLLSLIIFIVLFSLLSGCGPTPTSQPTATPAATVTAGIAIEMEAYKKVLKNESKLYRPDVDEYMTLSETITLDWGTDSFIAFTIFSINDMDGDGHAEILLQRDDVNSLTGVSFPYSIVILHYEEGKVVGYSFVYRALSDVKTDGTFQYSSSAFDNGFGRLQFIGDAAEMLALAYEKPADTIKSEAVDMEYYIWDKPVTAAQYELFSETQLQKENVKWYEFDDANIEEWLNKLPEFPTGSPDLFSGLQPTP